MAGEVHNKGVAWDNLNGSLTPVDRLRNERSDSPTPGLVEGTEPGEIDIRLIARHCYITLLE